MKLFYDIIPPKKIRKEMEKIEKKTPNMGLLMKKLIIKATCLLIIISLNWVGLSAVWQTFGFFSNTEGSPQNIFTAGVLDFELQSLTDFPDVCSNEPTERTISIVNYGNPFKYVASSAEFSGDVCDYVTLEANVDGGEPEYVGPLTGFNYGPLDFSEPDDWVLKVTFNPDLPARLLGQTCNFKFVFDGSQTKNDLPFGQGFGDKEEIVSNITPKVCCYTEIRSCGYWKTHQNVYKPHLPQTLGGYPTDEIVNTVTKANNILTAACGTCGCGCDETMRAKLKGQLLAMKFNIAHFGIGDYEYEGRTLDDIVAEADDLLRDLSTPDPILEEMKNLLDYLNDLHQIRFCRIPPPQIEEYIVVNEVYYDVKCHGEEGWNEWVEIYNPTDNPVDISGWKIADNGGEDTIPSSDSIPPDGFAVITPKASTWSKWPSIPSGAIKIVLESKIGNGLANDGDRVILRMPDGTEIDAISYGSDTYAFDPSVPDVAEGHSIARYPKGFDTDQASDWIDLSWPNPGTNPHASDEALIGMEGEIGCAEGQVYVPEERDTSEDPEEVVPEENQEESTQEEAAENSEEATEGETTTETPEPETPEETISGGTPQEIPVEEIPTEDIPGEETPTEEPAEETPEETPNEELPPEETLTEEMPTEDETQTPAVIPEDELTELSESNTSENPTESNPETSTETPTETPSEVPPETPTETSDSVPEI